MENFIDDDNDVLEELGLRFGREHRPFGFEYREKLIKCSDKKALYGKARRGAAGETLVPELDRIFAGRARCRGFGHPVHYFIRADDRGVFKETAQLLLPALYMNGRIISKRYGRLLFTADTQDFYETALDGIYRSFEGGTVLIDFAAGSPGECEYASAVDEMIERICERIKRFSDRVLTVVCIPKENDRVRDIFAENLGHISMVGIEESLSRGEKAESILKLFAKEKGVRTDSRLFSLLEEERGYYAGELREIFDRWYSVKLKTVVYPQYKELSSAGKAVAQAAPKGSDYEELMKMVGVDEAKKVIGQALAQHKAQMLFADRGMQQERPSLHMVFTGNPGTAKTTTARLFAGIFRENKLLSCGRMVEVGRGDLVGKYVGWTAPTIRKKFREAEGGVLFIDEAYSLVDDRSGSFGDEAINTIVQEMENHRDDVIVIFAGYPEKMESFLKRNPGLRSRITFHVHFEDYDSDELCRIADLIAGKKGFRLTEGARERLKKVFEAARRESDFGNGRFVRNVIEKAGMALAVRLLQMDTDALTSADISTICEEDIEDYRPAVRSERQIIGFLETA